MTRVVLVSEATDTHPMAAQRARAKSDSAAKKTGHQDVSVYRSLLNNGATVFTGYEELTSEATVLGIVGEQGLARIASEGESVELGPRDTISFPGPAERRFVNVSDQKGTLLMIIAGSKPRAIWKSEVVERVRADAKQ